MDEGGGTRDKGQGISKIKFSKQESPPIIGRLSYL